MKFTEICGYLGMVLVHVATFPVTFLALSNLNSLDTIDLPPLSMVLLLDIGLVLFLIRSIAQKDLLYSISNGVGVLAQTTMLTIILYNEYLLS